MSRISNRFFVTALEDGTTLHGGLYSTRPLSQGWNGSAAVPDWRIVGNQPIIYLVLMSGNSVVIPSSDVEWRYNGNVITFSQGGTSTDGRFQKTSYIYNYNGTPYTVQAIKIITNLANSSNVDMDTITVNGTYQSAIAFQASTLIRMSNITASGYYGIIGFEDGVSNITQKNQEITLYAELYGGDNGALVAVSDYTVDWYINGTAYTSQAFPHSSTTTSQGRYKFILGEGDVTDNAIVQANFKVNVNTVSSAYVAVDDLQDPEYMYIQYNDANANAASLKKGESVTFKIWIGTMENPTPDTSYSYFYLKLINSLGEVYTSSITGIPNVMTGSEWRPLVVTESKAQVTITYDNTIVLGKNMTGIIMASTEELTI